MSRNAKTAKGGDDPQDLENGKPSTEGSVDDANFKRFSLSEDKLNTGFWNNLSAVFIKRVNVYRRSKTRIFLEIFLPSAFMVFGAWIASLDFTFRSPSRMFTIDLYPHQQKLLIN